jgi:hypothetical protein
MDKLYYQLERLQKATFIQSAAGDDLDIKAGDFNLSRVQATKAVGVIRLSRLTPAPISGVDIPAGSIWTTTPRFTSFDAIQFTNPISWFMPADATFLDIDVEAVVAGTIGNVLANAVIVNSTNVPGVDSLANPLAFTGGGDLETDNGLRARLSLIFRGNNSGTESNYKSVLLGNATAVVSSVSIVGPGEPLMTRDSGVGGKADIYFKGSANPQTFTESFSFFSGVDHIIQPEIFDPPDFPNQRNVPVNSITSIEDMDTLEILVAGVDYTFVPDTTVFARSDRDQSKVTFANMPTRDGHTFLITYVADKTVGDLRTLIETYRPITADILIKEGVIQNLDATIKPFYAPGVSPAVAQPAMTLALQGYINELGLGGVAPNDQGNLPGLYVTEAIRRMSEVKINGLKAVTGFDKELTTIFKTGFPTTDSVITITKDTYFVLNAVSYI